MCPEGPQPHTATNPKDGRQGGCSPHRPLPAPVNLLVPLSKPTWRSAKTWSPRDVVCRCQPYRAQNRAEMVGRAGKVDGKGELWEQTM